MENNYIPDISFELGGGDLTIDDIKNQTQSASNNSSNFSDNNYDEEVEDNNIDNSSSNNNSRAFDFSSVEDFKIESESDFRSQVEEQLKNHGEEEDNNGVSDKNIDVYSAALQILREQNILNIPDDINELDEDTLNYIIEQDQEYRNQQAIDFVRNEAAARDPRLSELIDHVISGGNYEDAIVMKDIIDEQYNFAGVDVSQEQNQRMLIEMYIREGLNPESAVDQRRLARLEDEIESYINNNEGEDLANEAKEYFIEKLEYMKEAEKQKVMEREEQLRQMKQQKIEQERKWVNDFKKSLNEKPWSNEKKKEIVQQFDIVQLNNGEEVEMWKYKWTKIWENPNLTQVFMDFLSDLDPYSLEFKNRNVPVQKQVTNKILDIVNNKKTVSNKFKSDVRVVDRKKDSEPRKTINPADDW